MGFHGCPVKRYTAFLFLPLSPPLSLLSPSPRACCPTDSTIETPRKQLLSHGYLISCPHFKHATVVMLVKFACPCQLHILSVCGNSMLFTTIFYNYCRIFRKKCYFVDLFVRVSNAVAISMYTALGYVVYRRIIDYYSGENEEDAFGGHIYCFSFFILLLLFFSSLDFFFFESLASQK